MKAVIFDFNGTLFLDTPLHLEAWEKIYRKYHPGADEAPDRNSYAGACNDEIIRRIAPQLNEEERRACSVYKESVYRELCKEHPERVHLTEGAEEVFAALKRRGVPYALATASILDNVEFYFDTFKLDRWFDRSLCVYDDGSFADKGEFQVEAARRLGVPFSECLIVEDSVSAIGCARKRGAGFIVGIGETGSEEELLKAGADCRIHDFTEFDLAWLEK